MVVWSVMGIVGNDWFPKPQRKFKEDYWILWNCFLSINFVTPIHFMYTLQCYPRQRLESYSWKFSPNDMRYLSVFENRYQCVSKFMTAAFNLMLALLKMPLNTIPFILVMLTFLSLLLIFFEFFPQSWKKAFFSWR